MNVTELAHNEHMKLLIGPAAGRGDVARVFASNTMSDLIAGSGRDTLIVTSLNNSQIIRVAELMDVPGICLVADASPCSELVERARASGTAILLTPLGLEETRSLLERLLVSAKGAE
jgi:predicted peroxiredoxin